MDFQQEERRRDGFLIVWLRKCGWNLHSQPHHARTAIDTQSPLLKIKKPVAELDSRSLDLFHVISRILYKYEIKIESHFSI